MWFPMERQEGWIRWPVRMPSHPVARKLIGTTGIVLAAPSANTSGRPSPTRAEHVYEDLNGKIDMILDDGPVGWH